MIQVSWQGRMTTSLPTADSEVARWVAHDRPEMVRAQTADGTAYRPDAVIHLAAESHVDRSIDGPGVFVQTNVVGTYTLLEAARAYRDGLPEADRAAALADNRRAIDETAGLGAPTLVLVVGGVDKADKDIVGARSRVTEAVAEEVTAWQTRPLEAFYPVVYLDALVVKVRDGGHVANRSAHIAVGVDMDGVKHVLGIWIQAAEGEAKTSPATAASANPVPT